MRRLYHEFLLVSENRPSLAMSLSLAAQRVDYYKQIPSSNISAKASSNFHGINADDAVNGKGMAGEQHLSNGTGKEMWLSTPSYTSTRYCKSMREGVVWFYVGDFSYSTIYSTHITSGAIKAVQLGQEFTVRTGQPGGYNPSGKFTAFPNYSRKYFLRFGARTTMSFDGTNRYNYSVIKEIETQAR